MGTRRQSEFSRIIEGILGGNPQRKSFPYPVAYHHKDRTRRIPASTSLNLSVLILPIFSVKKDLSTVINSGYWI
jgi:hypothetical protein